MLQLLCVASFYLYVEILKKPGYIKLILLALINVLMLLSHYISLFIPVIQFLFSWYYFQKNRKGFWYYFISQCLAVILFFPWIRHVLSNVPKTGIYWLKTPDWTTFRIETSNLAGNDFLLYLFGALLGVFIILFLINLKSKNIFTKCNPWIFLSSLCMGTDSCFW